MSTHDPQTRDCDKRFTLRIDRDLFKLVEQSAKKNKRAIGREIEFILEQHLKKTHKE